MPVKESNYLGIKPVDPSPRLTDLLGRLRFLLNPWGAPLVGLLGWGLTAPFSTSASAMGLCWWGITLLIWCIQAERKWLNVLPFPPLTIISIHLFLRWELGGILLLLSGARPGPYWESTRFIEKALPINALFTTLLIGIPLIINLKLLRVQKNPAAVFDNDSSDQTIRRRWILITAITGFVAVGYALVGYYGGTLDRGPEYLRWAGRFWRPDTLFSATIRLRDLYFVLLPWAIYSLKKNRILLFFFLAPTIFSIFITSTLGGRGLLLYPLVLTIGGAWMAGIYPKTLRILLLLALAFSITFIPLATAFRDTTVARSSIIERIRLIGVTNPFSNFSLPSLGREFYTSSDYHLFVPPGINQKPAGFKRFGNLRYIWLPRIFGTSRPELNDGHLVAYEIRGTLDSKKHEGRYIAFESITTGGDLYWRFRWKGVIAGGVFAGLVYGFVCRYWYRHADLSKNIYTILIAIFPSTFLQGPPLRSVIETIWNWLYELPKYGIILLAIALIIEMICRFTSKSRL